MDNEKPFRTAEAAEEVLNMLENRNAKGIQVLAFIKLLTKRLVEKYNIKP